MRLDALPLLAAASGVAKGKALKPRPVPLGWSFQLLGFTADRLDQADPLLIQIAVQVIGLGPDVVPNQQMHPSSGRFCSPLGSGMIANAFRARSFNAHKKGLPLGLSVVDDLAD